MTFIMMLVGLGMVLGNLLSGRLSGRYTPLRIAVITDFVIVLALLLLFAFGGIKAASLTFAFICCAGLFALSAPLQILLLQNAKGRTTGRGWRANCLQSRQRDWRVLRWHDVDAGIYLQLRDAAGCTAVVFCDVLAAALWSPEARRATTGCTRDITTVYTCGHSRAAPRTPLESPCNAWRRGVSHSPPKTNCCINVGTF